MDSLNLTQREIEVLSYLAKGLTSEEISRLTYMSKRTVDAHRRNIIMKSRCKNTREAVFKAVNEGIISIGDGLGG
jgi:DNA-binding CsgD family transcriptional regulator